MQIQLEVLSKANHGSLNLNKDGINIKRIITLLLLFICISYSSYASEYIVDNFTFRLNSYTNAKVVLKRLIDDSLSDDSSSFGQELLEIITDDGISMYKTTNDYFNREDIILSEGDIEIVSINGFDYDFVLYSLHLKGVGTGVEKENIKKILIGWDGEDVNILFEFNAYEFEHIKPRFYTSDNGGYDKWQSEKFKKIKREMKFNDSINYRDADITINEIVYKKDNLITEKPKSIENLTEINKRKNFKEKKSKEIYIRYKWNGKKFQ
jgi:hypothetical protein